MADIAHVDANITLDASNTAFEEANICFQFFGKFNDENALFYPNLVGLLLFRAKIMQPLKGKWQGVSK